ncbi:D-2-hydroxyacid dehydrogenase [Chitinibacteraceae bacterium HSL-7]
MTPHIVFLDADSLPVAVRRPAFDHRWSAHAATAPEQTAARLAAADIAITNKVVIDAAVLDAAPQLKLIAVAATGYNVVDLAACRARGVTVCNIRDYAIHGVAEHTLMLMLALARALPAYQRDVAAGAWQQAPQFCHFGAPMHDLYGKRLCLIGSGALGQATAQLARAFGMDVLFVERRDAGMVRSGYVAFAEALATADVLSVHCPLNDETRDLIGAAELAQMKSSALLINTSRGGIVNEPALLEALNRRQIAGAALDVLTTEPPRSGHPLLDAQLPNLIITPHVAWASVETMTTLAEQLTGNIEAFVAGQPRNVVV